MQRRKAFLLAGLVALFLAASATAQIYDDDNIGRRTSSSRSRLQDLRSRYTNDSSDDFDDLRRDFGSIRDRTYGPTDRRSVTDWESRRRDSTSSRPTTPSQPGTAPRGPTIKPPPSSRSGPSVQPRRTVPVSVVGGQRPPSGRERGQPSEVLSSRPILYLEPADMFVTQGEPFEVELRLSNPTQELFDSMAATLAYDRAKLEPIDADPSTPEPELNSEWEALKERYGWLSEDPALYSERSDPEAGRVEIRLRAPAGKTDVLEGTLARFRFVPLGSQGQTALNFVFQDEEGGELRTYVRDQEEDVLGTPHRGDDGVLEANLRISPEVEIAESPEERSGDYKTRIQFDPPLVEAELGEVVDVDIILENPSEIPFDTLNLVLGYNPRILRVIDYDQNNWEKEGINIHDGDSVALFPFTDRLTNQVFRKEGVILYRAASLHEPIRAEGVIATIRFVAIGNTEEDGSPLKIGFHGVNQSLNSGLYLRGRDVLADSESAADGFSPFRIFIRRHEVSRSRNVWDQMKKVY